MDISILEDLGLSNAEAKIYLALLELGSSKTGKIIDATKLQSSTVYHVLGSLVEKGFVSYIFKGKIKYYQAEKPESFLLFLEEKKRKFQEILPELKEKQLLSEKKHSAKVYEGINGLKTAFNDILTSLKEGQEYYFFQFPQEKLLDERITLFLRNYHLKRSKKGIRVKGLAIKDSKESITKLFDKIPFTKIKYLKEFIPTGLIVYSDKIMTLDWQEIPTTFVIQSKSITESYKKFFEEKWKQARD